MIELNKENFEAEVLQHPERTLVFFSGAGWVPCEAIKPFVVGCSEKYGDKLRFAILDTSAAKRLAMSQKVMALPTIVLYEGGQKAETLLGKENVTEGKVEELIQKYI